MFYRTIIRIWAKTHQTIEPKNCIYNVKRIIGKQFTDSDVRIEQGLMSYDIVNEDGYPRIRVQEHGQPVDYSPEEISSILLTYLKRTTEEFLGSKVKSAVITVPANFNDAQRKATKLAAEMAGLQVLQILNEPTAAAMAYGADLQGKQNLLVFDFGGGTLDVSILEVENANRFRVRATAGNMRLGGEDIDQRIVQHMLKVIKSQYGIDASRDEKLKIRLKHECEAVKRQLSSVASKRIAIANLFGTKSFIANFTRQELEDICSDLFEKTLEPVREALKMAKMTQKDIAHVILIGGSSYIPKVRELLTAYFPDVPLRKSIDPSQAVAKGAALLASSISLGGTNLDLKLEDVTPLTLGVNVFGGFMSALIPKGTRLPAENEQNYTTFKNDQEYIDIDVYEGEDSRAKSNHYLGNFKFSGIRPAPKGEPCITIHFKVDTSGILMVTASEGANKMSMTFREHTQGGAGSNPPDDRNTQQAKKRLQDALDRAKRDVARDEQRLIRVECLVMWFEATKNIGFPLMHYERWGRILQAILS
ncbi:uncharacterized protein LOC129591953 [Paramacrobiotus metropolitanus]|uniref:uncharacterized protein LOC129591953 n=1 Tax=Paramacrobiotus metropolitanus TaxID=2943436 RepID=UPI002445F4F9|nr:uncharacterized protein LOC129591953 [Paramacrobiotus metropolitanus]